LIFSKTAEDYPSLPAPLEAITKKQDFLYITSYQVHVLCRQSASYLPYVQKIRDEALMETATDKTAAFKLSVMVLKNISGFNRKYAKIEATPGIGMHVIGRIGYRPKKFAQHQF